MDSERENDVYRMAAKTHPAPIYRGHPLFTCGVKRDLNAVYQYIK